ncbi:MAG: hypothetical protein M5T61_07630 [Acidimicrobiia bacterium]|nr:hypothetical protein [Acidimicrobiia bacterium]
MEGTCPQHRPTALQRERGPRHHHVRPPGHADAGLGVAGGGPKNEQSIDDLVAYVGSIQITPEEARAEAVQALADAKAQPQIQLDDAKAAVDAAEVKLAEVEADKEATPEQVADAQAALDAAEAGLAWAEDWFARRDGVSDGQILYELNCARCHTANWSVFDPTTNTPEEIGLGIAGGGGTQGIQPARWRDDPALRPRDRGRIRWLPEPRRLRHQRLREQQALRRQRRRLRPHARLRGDAHRRPDHRHRRVRAHDARTERPVHPRRLRSRS